jgi:hypothetical protein
MSSPVSSRVYVTTDELKNLNAKSAGAAPGDTLQVTLGGKPLAMVVVEHAGGGFQPPDPLEAPATKKKHPGGKPQDIMANKLMNALYDDYKTLKATFCSQRAANLGVNLKDILLGNKTKTFSKFRHEFIDKAQPRKDYYYSSTPPTTFDADGKDWLEMYWAKNVQDRPPRDRAAEKMKRKKMRETSLPGGSAANGDMSD